MKTKKLVPIFILCLLLITILYVMLAVKPLGKEYQFSPQWKISTSTPSTTNNTTDAKQMYYRLNNSIGYFTEDGKITFNRTFNDKVSISDSYFAVYDSTASNTPFFNNKGKKVGEIKEYGFPYFKNNLIFVLLPGGCSFAKCDVTGNVTWNFEGTVPITAFAPKENYTAVGFANGYIKVFNTETGALLLTYAPGGSDYPVILGLDISDDGEYIASISGQDKQRFVLSHREGNQQKIIFHRFLDSKIFHRTLVHFTRDNNKIIYNYEGKIGIFDISKLSDTIIPINDQVIAIEETDDFICLLSRNKNKHTITIIENTNSVEGSFDFIADSAFLKTDDNNLYIGKDNSISKIVITKE